MIIFPVFVHCLCLYDHHPAINLTTKVKLPLPLLMLKICNIAKHKQIFPICNHFQQQNEQGN